MSTLSTYSARRSIKTPQFFLENAAHDLDKKVASQSDKFLLPVGMLLKIYGAQWDRAYKSQERLVFEEGCLGFSELNDSQQQIGKYTHRNKYTNRESRFFPHTQRASAQGRTNSFSIRHSIKQAQNYTPRIPQ